MVAPLLKGQPPAPRLEVEDIQALVLRGYGRMKGSEFLALRIADPARAIRWLERIAPEITYADVRDGARHLNVAFTFDALQLWGLPAIARVGFPNEFREGLGPRTTSLDGMEGEAHRIGYDRRSEVLGDVGESSPEHWRWGGEDRPVHVALLLYTRNGDEIAEYARAHEALASEHGLEVVARDRTFELPGRKEHFGFRDGISQPAVRNANRRDERVGVLKLDEVPEFNHVEAGEFVLGYRNGYGAYPESPILPATMTAADLLPDWPLRPGYKDFGRNGSYMVWRQLEQNVRSFWQHVQRSAPSDDGRSLRRQAAKLVGRWPSGAPLPLAPDEDDAALEDANDFLYMERDPHGYHAPFGSHIRRGNPRDWNLATKPDESLVISNRHRIIRRARPYGAPVAASMEPEDILAANDETNERGVHFILFNADIERQFEFVQGTWLAGPRFAGLNDEVDPVLGPQPDEGGTFTIQASPVRTRIQGLPRFTTVRGGAYFFMPGRSGVQFMSAISPD